MLKYKRLIIPAALLIIYIFGVILQGALEAPPYTASYTDSMRIINSRGLWQKLTAAQVIELAQTLCDNIAEDTGLRPIRVVRHDFGAGSNTSMSWSRSERIVRVNLNLIGLSPDKFVASLGHEILGHAVQDALVAGEQINADVPEDIINIWRENSYIRPPYPRDYDINEHEAQRQYQAYRGQSVEEHANKAGADFRKQTRIIVVRLPDDIEFKLVFAAIIFIFSLILIYWDSEQERSFEECILALRDEKNLQAMRDLHIVLSRELGMDPLRVREGRSTCYDWVAVDISKPDLIAEVAGETWRACAYEFGDNISEAMAEYISEVKSRAEEIAGENIKINISLQK